MLEVEYAVVTVAVSIFLSRSVTYASALFQCPLRIHWLSSEILQMCCYSQLRLIKAEIAILMVSLQYEKEVGLLPICYTVH